MFQQNKVAIAAVKLAVVIFVICSLVATVVCVNDRLNSMINGYLATLMEDGSTSKQNPCNQAILNNIKHDDSAPIADGVCGQMDGFEALSLLRATCTEGYRNASTADPDLIEICASYGLWGE